MDEPASDSPTDRIAALEAELAALRAEMQHFSYAVSHDLRTPLRHIVSFARLVQEDAGPQLSEEVQEFLTTITDAAHRMGKMLDGLLALSRVGTVALDSQSVSLQELVEAAVRELEEQHPQRAIDWHIGQGLPLVQADPALLRQALQQILANAVQFSTPRERAVIEVSHSLDARGDWVTLQVRDNGIGYNPAQQAQLFRVFGPLHSPSQFAGMGLGLVMAKKILERLGGSLALEGAVDAGCIARLRLQAIR